MKRDLFVQCLLQCCRRCIAHRTEVHERYNRNRLTSHLVTKDSWKVPTPHEAALLFFLLFEHWLFLLHLLRVTTHTHRIWQNEGRVVSDLLNLAHGTSHAYLAPNIVPRRDRKRIRNVGVLPLSPSRTAAFLRVYCSFV